MGVVTDLKNRRQDSEGRREVHIHTVKPRMDRQTGKLQMDRQTGKQKMDRQMDGCPQEHSWTAHLSLLAPGARS